MKINDIKTGSYYYDGKKGVRQVLAIDEAEQSVKFKLLSAKQSREFNNETGQMETIINTVSTMKIASFAAWAKSGHNQESIGAVLLTLQAKAMSLSPKESAFMRTALDEVDGRIKAGLSVSVDQDELRACRGLAKKGLLDCQGDEVAFTALGQAWAETQGNITQGVASKRENYTITRADLASITDLDLAFGTERFLPALEDIPDEFKSNAGNDYTTLAEAIFSGSPIAKFRMEFFTGFDDETAATNINRCVRAHLCSFSPKHEHKIAGVAWMMAQVFRMIPMDATP